MHTCSTAIRIKNILTPPPNPLKPFYSPKSRSVNYTPYSKTLQIWESVTLHKRDYISPLTITSLNMHPSFPHWYPAQQPQALSYLNDKTMQSTQHKNDKCAISMHMW